MSDVIVVVGAGSIGQAIARRVSAGKKVLLASLRQESAEAAAVVMRDAGCVRLWMRACDSWCS